LAQFLQNWSCLFSLNISYPNSRVLNLASRKIQDVPLYKTMFSYTHILAFTLTAHSNKTVLALILKHLSLSLIILLKRYDIFTNLVFIRPLHLLISLISHHTHRVSSPIFQLNLTNKLIVLNFKGSNI